TTGTCLVATRDFTALRDQELPQSARAVFSERNQTEHRLDREPAVPRRRSDRSARAIPQRGTIAARQRLEPPRIRKLRSHARNRERETIEIVEQTPQRIVPPCVDRIREAIRRAFGELTLGFAEHPLEIVELSRVRPPAHRVLLHRRSQRDDARAQ